MPGTGTGSDECVHVTGNSSKRRRAEKVPWGTHLAFLSVISEADLNTWLSLHSLSLSLYKGWSGPGTGGSRL
jgi:hypothetical protein